MDMIKIEVTERQKLHYDEDAKMRCRNTIHER
jgi:hypothetical protein